MEDEIALEQLGNRFSTLAGTVGPRASGFFCSCGKGGQGACHCRRHSRDRGGALSYTRGEWAYLISHVEAPIREEVVVGVHVAGRATPPHLGTKRDTDRTCGPYQHCWSRSLFFHLAVLLAASLSSAASSTAQHQLAHRSQAQHQLGENATTQASPASACR